ncbi:MAG: hypothetical protein ACLFTT_10890 [Candidatus Hydrogenedentota bacterium]
MKVEDFAHRVSVRTMELLGELQHYKITEDLQKEVTKRIRTEVNQILKESS